MSFYSKLSMRTKLLLLAITTLMIVGAGSWLSLEKMSSSYTHRSLELFGDMARNIGESISAQFYERYGDVQAFASNESIKSFDRGEMQIALDSYIKLYGIYDLILVVNSKGQFVAANSLDASGKKINQENLKAFDFSSEEWFKAAIKGQTTDDKTNNFSGTYFEDVMEDPMIKLALGEARLGNSFSSPIRNAKGDIVGVITNRAGERWIQYDLKRFLAQLKAAEYSTSEIYVLDKNGLVLQNLEVAEQEKAGAKAGEANGSAEEQLKVNLVKDDNDLAKKAVSGHSGSGFTMNKIEKREDAGGYHFINDSKWISSIGWSVVVMDEKDEVLKNVAAARNQFLIMMAVACLLSLTLSIWFSVVLTKSLNSVTNSLNQNSGEVTEASIRIAAQATELSEAATEQAAALQETMSAVDEISAMVEKNAEAASRSKEVSANSKEAAERGRGIVDQMLSAIGEIDATNIEISQQMEHSNQELSEITKLISDIGTKTRVINEIVFQTKLLSFNASVEAARAGEYGKGFSVVAEEVGNLAQMSGNAAKEITALLEESVRKVDQIVGQSKSRVEKMVRISREKVDIGSKTAKDCNVALEEILSNVENVDSLVSEIAVASQEQSTGIKEISKAVGQMEQVTQQNSSVAQSSSVSAEQLKVQATGLNEIVRSLVGQVNGSGAQFQEQLPEVQSSVVSISKKVKSTTKTRTVAQQEGLKKASGSEFVPSSDDPGFGE